MQDRLLFKKNQNHSDLTPLRSLFLIGFLFSINVALTAYINSNFLEKFIPENLIGIVYMAGSIISLLGLLLMPQLLKRFGNYKMLLFSLVVTAISLLSFSAVEAPWLVIVFFVLYLGLRTLIYFGLDELLETYSSKSTMGKTRGLYMTVLSLGWMFSPFLSGIIIDALGFEAVYTASLISVFLSTLGVIVWFRHYKDPAYPPKVPLVDIFKKLFGRINIYRIYLINLLLQFFYAWAVIYMPIYLYRHIGFDWATLGIMFTIMLLPFVLFELPLGTLEDKKYGEKEIMSLGIVIMVLSIIGISLFESHNVIFWTALLFFTRTGAAMVEISVETYFFKKVDAEETDLISFYRNASPLAYIVAPLIVSGLLLIMPMQSTFLVLAFILTFGLVFSTRLVDTK